MLSESAPDVESSLTTNGVPAAPSASAPPGHGLLHPVDSPGSNVAVRRTFGTGERADVTRTHIDAIWASGHEGYVGDVCLVATSHLTGAGDRAAGYDRSGNSVDTQVVWLPRLV
jgi:hypothetical protein